KRDARADHLEPDASNLVNVLRTLRGTPTYDAIIEDVRVLLDMVEGIDTSVEKGRVILMLKERPFDDPVEALSASDGTLRLLALLTALHLMPEHGLLCVEEIEHGLHPHIFGPLLDIVRQRCPAEGARQIVVTTHSPDLLDAAQTNEVVVVDRTDGRTTLSRLRDRDLAKWRKEFRLGELWRMRQLGGV
ncbi:MAG: chromosome segregation protein SMC, partial [Deltaproteobacteria bacterium]|nr:chromosome segregation protein SMC [Deltaproteobacteria bacterium]